MWFGIAFFIFSPFHGLAMFVGMIIQKLTFVMLWALKVMDAQPIAVSKGIVLTTGQVWILYGIISAILVYVFSKKKQWLFYVLFLILALQCSLLETNYNLLNQKHIFVYNTRNTMIHLIDGRNNYLVTNDSIIPENDLKMTRKVIDHLRLNSPIILDKNKISNFNSRKLILDGNLLQFLNCSIKFNEKSKYQNTDILSLQAQNRNINISTGSPYSKANQDLPINFYTKSDGAYHFQIE
jgi:hypothetical protein